jgi:hypothetical protein
MVYHSKPEREDYEKYKDSIQELFVIKDADGSRHFETEKGLRVKVEPLICEPFTAAPQGSEHHIEIILKAVENKADAYCEEPGPRRNAVQLYKIKD